MRNESSYGDSADLRVDLLPRQDSPGGAGVLVEEKSDTDTQSVDGELNGREVSQPPVAVGQMREAGRSRMQILLLAGAGVVALTLATASAVEGVRQYRQSVEEQRAAAKKLADENRKAQEIASLRAELPRGRKWAEQALAWRPGMERKTLMSALAAMEQWIGDVDNVRGYEKAHDVRLSVADVAERLDEERILDTVRKSTAELRGLLEQEGPVVIQGRRIFY